MNDTQKLLIYLLYCAANGITPDIQRVNNANLPQLYKAAKKHSVRAAVYIALKRAGVEDKQFDQAYKKSIRKCIYLDLERMAISADLEKHGIWYMPLKGSVLKDIYPENGMREMADNDVLFNADKQEQIREIMIAHGYTVVHYGEYNHDVYQKPPVLNFEMHTSLFSNSHAAPLYRYYSDIERLLKKDEGNKYGYHLSDEDFYVFMTAHEWKHHNGSGTGIRSLMDCYVYCKVKGDTLDWKYIEEQCRSLEIAAFEQERRQLAVKVFSSDTLDLTQSEQDLLMEYLTSGTYGNFENSVKKKLKDQSKLSFWVHSVFIPREQMNISVPFTSKSPLLYPVGVLWRCGRVLFFKRNRLKQAIKTVNKYGK